MSFCQGWGEDLNYVYLQLGFVFVDRFSFTYWVQGNKMIFGTHAASQTSPIYNAILLTKEELNAVVWVEVTATDNRG